ncbi:hypothetical protein [Rheinheimera sp. UJ63]|uniref:hypothetical protein n=1 Tax=Rheinheimera sp. UJ63 TaxID=2910157 RepID=UPI001F211107|nr:hypothetical protein [Rheinheimera sp. UJ63]MCF4007816.1 hypothetical protein [Rheinheimera sp. UJ63]
MKKTILAVGLLAASIATAQAASIITWDFSGTGGSAAPNSNNVDGPTVNDTMNFTYNSQSLVFDADGSGTLSDGDTIRSFGGWGANGFNSAATPLSSTGSTGFGIIGSNFINGFAPDGSPAPINYNSSYVFTFQFNNLMGTYSSAASNFIYTSGEIKFGLLSYSATTGFAPGTSANRIFHPLFNLDLVSGGPVTAFGQVQQVFKGTIDPTSISTAAGAGFTLTSPGNGTKTLGQWAALDSPIFFELSQTVKGGLRDIPFNPQNLQFDANGNTLLAASHDGSVRFSVPQPASISILALGLLGLRLASRKAKK